MSAVAVRNEIAQAPSQGPAAPPQPAGLEFDASLLQITRPAVAVSSTAAWPSWIASGAIHLLLFGGLILTPNGVPVERVTLAGSRFVLSCAFSEDLPAAIAPTVVLEVEAVETSDEPLEELAPKVALEVHLKSTVDLPAEPPPFETPIPKPAVATKTTKQPLAKPTPQIQTPKKPTPVELANEEPPPPPKAASAPTKSSVTAKPASTGLEDVTPAKPLLNPPPVFPREAIENNWSGRVVVRLSINSAGKVTLANLVESSGFTLLDNSAIQAVRKWEFHPAHQGGTPVEYSTLIPVRFYPPVE